MEAVGSSVLSPTLRMVFDRIASNQKFLNDLFPGNRKVQLKRLIRVLRIVSPVLEDAENKQDNSPAVKTWFHGLKHAVYQADDVLDEIDIERLRIQVQHSNGNLSDTDCSDQLIGELSRRLHQICEALKNWFNGLKHAVCQTDDVLDEINAERMRIQEQHSNGHMSDTDFSDQFIGELSPRLEQICEALERKVQRIGVLGLGVLYGKPRREDKTPTTSMVIPSQIFGRDDEKEKIIQMVLYGEGGTDICVIPITGMGGVGKTTLAQLVYNDERVKNHFQTRAWVCVSEEFDVHRVTKDLLNEVNSIADDKDDLNGLQVKLKSDLKGKRFIIILDDIWNDNYSDCQCLMVPLRSGSRGSKIVVTTRNENIALMLQNESFQCVKPIPNDQSLSLFKLHAFDNKARHSSPEFEKIGITIVERCKGLPLAIKTIAGALRSKDDIREWHDIMSSDNWMVVGDIMPALSLSYKLLPSHLKSCFAFCAVFPKDVPFDKEEVALLWMANDLVQPSNQKVAQNYFEELRSLSFFEKVKNNKYVMHDLINDLARIISGNFCARMEDYQIEDLYQVIQVKNDLPPEVLHFSYISSPYDTLKRFRGLAQVQGLRTFLTLGDENKNYRLTTTFFTDILPKFGPIRALSLHQCRFSVIPYSIGDLKHLRFLHLGRSYIKKLPNDMTQCRNLQTLILAGCQCLEELPEDMSLLINLQHLDISGCEKLKELPKKMSLLINLQHLDISGCEKLKELPKDMSLLINLQHLDVANCSDLEKLPEHIGLLINLQHLDIKACSKLEKLPEAMGLLINLQYLNVSRCSWLKALPKDLILLINLQYLNVSRCSWLKALPEHMGLLINLQHLDVSGCSELEILQEDMRHLINLQHLNVKGCYKLEKFPEVMGLLINLKHPDDPIYDKVLTVSLDNCYTIEKAKSVELKNKSCIEELTLEGSGIPERSEEELKIFSELIPHTNIRELSICRYGGTIFANWLGDSSFCNIKSLTLKDCKNCFHLPPLGQLTGLKILDISGMDAITEVGQEFYGNSSMCKPFPVLEVLMFSKMAEWTTWNTPPDNTEFLSLRGFSIEECPKLVGVIPFLHTSLIISLYLQSNSIHVEFLSNDSCQSSIEGLTIPISTEPIPLFSFTKLQRLEVEYWKSPNLFQFPNGYHQSLTSLQSLDISHCHNILSFPEGGLPAPNLKEFYVFRCSKLKSLPEQMHTQLSSLRHLTIGVCPEMECFPDGGLPPSLETLNVLGCEKLMMFPRNWGLQRLPSLIKLTINGIEDKLFPEEGLLPASLKILTIENCPNLEALNHKGFQDITSLQFLLIQRCLELIYLPDGLPSSLPELHIYDCPKLKASIEREKGEYWPKISHIPLIEVDWELIS